MSSNFKKVLYLGAWDHIEVVNYFPNCNEFILIETKPRSEHDQKDYFYEPFYRDKFLKRVIRKCKKYGFILDKITELDPNYINNIKIIDNVPNGRDLKDIPYINPHLLIFNNHSNHKQIKYYISTNILFNMNPILEKDIFEADTLYVAGYSPDIILLKYININKKINFVGDDNTVYFYEPDVDENSIISNYNQNKIKLNDSYIRFFSECNYYLVWRKKSMIIVCDSLEDINDKIHQLNKHRY